MKTTSDSTKTYMESSKFVAYVEELHERLEGTIETMTIALEGLEGLLAAVAIENFSETPPLKKPV